MGLAFALDLNAPCESSGVLRIGDNWEFHACNDFTSKIRQSKITKVHQKSDISDDFVIYFHVCTVDW